MKKLQNLSLISVNFFFFDKDFLCLFFYGIIAFL